MRERLFSEVEVGELVSSAEAPSWDMSCKSHSRQGLSLYSSVGPVSDRLNYICWVKLVPCSSRSLFLS